MVRLALALDVVPQLPEHLLVGVGFDGRQNSLWDVRTPIAAGLAKQQDVLDVVFDDRPRLIGLAEEPGVATSLETRVSDLVPDDGREVVEADVGGVFLNRRVQREHTMPPMIAPGAEDVPNDHTEPATGHKLLVDVLPDLVDEFVELLVIVDIPELAFRPTAVFDVVVLQVKIRRRGDRKMHRLVVDHREVTRIAVIEVVVTRERFHCLFDVTHPSFVAGQRRDFRLELLIGQLEQVTTGIGNMLAKIR